MQRVDAPAAKVLAGDYWKPRARRRGASSRPSLAATQKERMGNSGLRAYGSGPAGARSGRWRHSRICTEECSDTEWSAKDFPAGSCFPQDIVEVVSRVQARYGMHHLVCVTRSISHGDDRRAISSITGAHDNEPTIAQRLSEEMSLVQLAGAPISSAFGAGPWRRTASSLVAVSTPAKSIGKNIAR